VDGGSYVYVTCLSKVEEKETTKEKDEPKGE
jgi:hypothetical protein